MTDPTPDRPTSADEPVGAVPASTGGTVALDRVIGTIPLVLVFVQPPDDPAVLELLRSLGASLADFGRDRIQLLAVANIGSADVVQLGDQISGNARILADEDGALAARFGAEYRSGWPMTVFVDETGEVRERWTDDPGGAFATTVLAHVSTID